MARFRDEEEIPSRPKQGSPIVWHGAKFRCQTQDLPAVTLAIQVSTASSWLLKMNGSIMLPRLGIAQNAMMWTGNLLFSDYRNILCRKSRLTQDEEMDVRSEGTIEFVEKYFSGVRLLALHGL